MGIYDKISTIIRIILMESRQLFKQPMHIKCSSKNEFVQEGPKITFLSFGRVFGNPFISLRGQYVDDPSIEYKDEPIRSRGKLQFSASTNIIKTSLQFAWYLQMWIELPFGR